MEYETLEVSIEGREDDVFRIAFDEPDRLNVVGGRMHEELSRVFREAYDADVRVVVVTGNGDAFSAGGDVGWMQGWIDDPEVFRETVSEGEEIIESLVNLEVPVIARVNGDAVGLGATLALHCDIVIASEDARIGDPHVQVGLAAGDGGAVIWPLLTSFNTAKEYLMTGELIPAEEAAEMGLVNHVVPPEELDRKVEERIETLASLPQPAVRYSKMAANAWLEMGVEQVLRESLALEGLSAQSPDHHEAVEAFVEGRQPEPPSARSPEDGE
jgi:enoyl-CoA hydratase